ncbi:hypothetical protein BDV96DRAFT_661393 [Lophiotrema nucula]|uniref:Uncharacterized protein n=1 Tax=Lophiotrema nucula TaxID=690887 RepID=A0A6A5Z413_9PLEO|nr:hypothetical protein BDV96DRAFT_661393 [Lophiotrema nucula]
MVSPVDCSKHLGSRKICKACATFGWTSVVRGGQTLLYFESHGVLLRIQSGQLGTRTCIVGQSVFRATTMQSCRCHRRHKDTRGQHGILVHGASPALWMRKTSKGGGRVGGRGTREPCETADAAYRLFLSTSISKLGGAEMAGADLVVRATQEMRHDHSSRRGLVGRQHRQYR